MDVQIYTAHMRCRVLLTLFYFLLQPNLEIHGTKDSKKTGVHRDSWEIWKISMETVAITQKKDRLVNVILNVTASITERQKYSYRHAQYSGTVVRLLLLDDIRTLDPYVREEKVKDGYRRTTLPVIWFRYTEWRTASWKLLQGYSSGDELYLLLQGFLLYLYRYNRNPWLLLY